MTPKHLFLLAIIATALSGCNSSTPQATDQQIKDFKGGPMPPEVAKMLQEQQAKNHGPKAPPPGVGGPAPGTH